MSGKLSPSGNILKDFFKSVAKTANIPSMPELTGAEFRKEQTRKEEAALAAAEQKRKSMPTPTGDTQQAMLARRKSMARQRARKGRASTILTGDRETLG